MEIQDQPILETFRAPASLRDLQAFGFLGWMKITCVRFSPYGTRERFNSCVTCGAKLVSLNQIKNWCSNFSKFGLFGTVIAAGNIKSKPITLLVQNFWA